jgi:hypothetical protein
MRCRRCQRAISGIGKPAVPPVIPAAIAFAGGIGGLWSLTLGQDPSNALPHWSPVGGWSLGLGSLALASVLAWIGLVRRRCPECGSSQMLDGMEEEAVLASEGLAVRKSTLAEARAELAGKPQILEQELRTRLVRELEPQVEHDLRGRIEQELRREVEQRLRVEYEQRSAEHERLLRSKLEEAPTPPPMTLAPIKEVPPARSPATARSTTPSPATTARAFTSSVAPRPATPPPSTTARAFTSSSAPQAVAGANPPHAAVPTAVKEGTPSPGRPFSARADGPAAISRAAVKTTTPAPSAVTRTALPAVPHAKVDTAPLPLMSSPGRATIGSKASVGPVEAPPPKAASSVVAPSSDHPAPGKDSGSNGPGNAGT